MCVCVREREGEREKEFLSIGLIERKIGCKSV